MAGRIESKRYYRIEFRLMSAMSIGSGDNELTDKDIVRDSRGIPYIPAAALAGVYRSLFTEKAAKRYFGQIADEKRNEDAMDSRLIVYDAELCGDSYCASTRDCVALDEWKTAVDGAKFDFEVLEPGVRFVTYLEQNKENGDENAGDVIARAWKEGRIAVGGKTARGLGRTLADRVQIVEFPLGAEHSQSIEDWLDFDVYDADCWAKCLETYGGSADCSCGEKGRQEVKIHLELKQKGPISIRVYTTDLKDAVSRANEQASQPDYEQLTYKRIEDGREISVPVIPGTSWAGCFRHHMERLDKNSIGDLFGYSGEKAKKKSQIWFGESEIEGAAEKVVTRNAIDRFSGGAADSALFTEKMYRGGHTSLDIAFPRSCGEEFHKCLAAAVADLHMGFLSVGGETSIGHGLFEVESVTCNGDTEQVIPGDGEGLYRKLFSMISAACDTEKAAAGKEM